MGIFSIFKPTPIPTTVKKPRKKKVKTLEAVSKEIFAKEKKKKKKTIDVATDLNKKELATMAGEPYINVISFELDKENGIYGNFELDWNDLFVARLVKAGFQGKTDNDIVDQWFKLVCSGVVAELYEQENADPEKRSRTQRKKLSDGRAEIS